MITKTARNLRWAALVSVSLLLLAGATMPVFAAENSGIGGKPANPRADNPRTESIFVYELSPGASTEDAVQIFNNSEETKTINVYATDAIVSSGGAFACAQAADQVKDVGTWIKLSKSSVKLAPGKNEIIPFTVTLPKDTEPGEHNGCIAIQEADVEAANVGNGIALSFRSAIRVAITVPGDIKKELSIKDVTLTNKADKLIGTILLRNNGNVSLDATIDTKLSGIFGGVLQTINGTYPALPQTLTELNFEYKQPYWGGFYRLDTTASYNANVAESLGEGSTTAQTSKSSSYIFVWPKASALAIEIAVIFAVVAASLYAWRRFIVHPKLAKKYHDYTVKEGDNIQQLAKANSVKWKHLAQINSIKPPYALTVGIVIKVPNKPDEIATKEVVKNETEKKVQEPTKKVESKTTEKATSPAKTKKAAKSTAAKKSKTSAKKKSTTKKKTTTAKKKQTKKEQ